MVPIRLRQLPRGCANPNQGLLVPVRVSLFGGRGAVPGGAGAGSVPGVGLCSQPALGSLHRLKGVIHGLLMGICAGAADWRLCRARSPLPRLLTHELRKTREPSKWPELLEGEKIWQLWLLSMLCA